MVQPKQDLYLLQHDMRHKNFAQDSRRMMMEISIIIEISRYIDEVIQKYEYSLHWDFLKEIQQSWRLF